MRAISLALPAVLLALWPTWIEAQGADCDGDFDGDGNVAIHELITAVNNSLKGCPPPQERYADNGDGTLTDTKTNLLWEKKSADESIHDWDKRYTWSIGSHPDGTVFTSFLAALNSPPCFANHCDWRLPSPSELQSLVDYGRWAPAIDPVFNTGCEPGCTVTTCSCTRLDYHWSNASSADPPGYVWNVDFNLGYMSLFDQTLDFPVRAVRSAP